MCKMSMLRATTEETYRESPKEKGDASVEMLNISIWKTKSGVEIETVREKFVLLGFRIYAQPVVRALSDER